MRRKQSPFKYIINCIYNLDLTTINWLMVFGPTGPGAEPVFPATAAARFPVLPSLLFILVMMQRRLQLRPAL